VRSTSSSPADFSAALSPSRMGMDSAVGGPLERWRITRQCDKGHKMGGEVCHNGALCGMVLVVIGVCNINKVNGL
jgi:hypothetical protein